jgi:hypothetical protein
LNQDYAKDVKDLIDKIEKIKSKIDGTNIEEYHRVVGKRF